MLLEPSLELLAGGAKGRVEQAALAGRLDAHRLAGGSQDVEDDVVDRVDVAPRLAGGIGGGLDHVEMDAVGPEIPATQQADDVRRPGPRAAEGALQPAALPRAHRAV